VVYIYALRQGKNVVYVGQCKNVERRVKEHKKSKEFDGYAVLETLNVDDLSVIHNVEDFYIKKFDPVYNKSLNVCGHYFDINDYFEQSEYKPEMAKVFMETMGIKPIFNENYKIHDLFRCCRKMEDWRYSNEN